MTNKRIITCAITGAAPLGRNRAVPVTSREIAESALGAAAAGAAIVHIHVRDPATGEASMDLVHYREVVSRIRDANGDVVLNLTTGAGGTFYPGAEERSIGRPESNFARPERRIEHVLELKPEICSLDLTTMWFGTSAYINPPDDIRAMASAIRAAGVLPELEVFHPGDIVLAKDLIRAGDLASPALFQMVLGISYGAPADSRSMLYMADLLPPQSIWSGFGIASQSYAMVAQAAMLGGHVRVGLEDNLYLSRGQLAPSNAALVEKAVATLACLDLQPATPGEARKILGLIG